MDESDADLLEATARGDAEAFGRFYRRHEQRVLCYAIARCANAGDVADAVGETFLGALGSAARFSGGGSNADGDAIPWLFGIARRVLAHQRRSFARRQRLVRRLERRPRRLLRDYAPDPAALRQALAKAGVPALVTVGSVCSAHVPSSALNQVLTSRRHLTDGTTILTIVPSAIPAGWELNIGYFEVPGGNGIHVSLVPEGARLTCSSAPPFVTG
jgi:Sigma-70 region 2